MIRRFASQNAASKPVSPQGASSVPTDWRLPASLPDDRHNPPLRSVSMFAVRFRAGRCRTRCLPGRRTRRRHRSDHRCPAAGSPQGRRPDAHGRLGAALQPRAQHLGPRRHHRRLGPPARRRLDLDVPLAAPRVRHLGLNQPSLRIEDVSRLLGHRPCGAHIDADSGALTMSSHLVARTMCVAHTSVVAKAVAAT
jgi:hypothetical protein